MSEMSSSPQVDVDWKHSSSSIDALHFLQSLGTASRPIHDLRSRLELLRDLKADRHDGTVPAKLLGFSLRGSRLEPRDDVTSRRTIEHLNQQHRLLFRRIKEFKGSYKSMTPFHVDGVLGRKTEVAVHLDLGLVFSVVRGRAGSVHSVLLYSFHMPLPLLKLHSQNAGNDVETVVEEFNSTDSCSVPNEEDVDIFDRETRLSHKRIHHKHVHDRHVDGRDWIDAIKKCSDDTVKDVSSLVSAVLCTLLPFHLGCEEPDGCRNIGIDHLGYPQFLMCLGVESHSDEYPKMVCDEYGKVTCTATDMYFRPVQFRILNDENDMSIDVVGIQCLGMGPKENYFLALVGDDETRERFEVELADEDMTGRLVPKDKKFHFKMKTSPVGYHSFQAGYRFQAVEGKQPYLAFGSDGLQERVTDEDMNRDPTRGQKTLFVFHSIVS